MSIARDVEDAALGCFLGACIGDAAGGTLEFPGVPKPDDVERAIGMCGGGFCRQIGFIRIAFVNAFQHLLQGTSYEKTIRDTLQKGGDTDTNACIAGALVGAATGAESIPKPMKAAVLDCDMRKGRPRPEFLRGRRVPELTKALLSAAEWSPR
jgi:hypothetical protein